MMGIFLPSWLSPFTVLSGRWFSYKLGHMCLGTSLGCFFEFHCLLTCYRNNQQHGTEPHALEWSSSHRPFRIEMGPLRIHLTHFQKNPCFPTFPWSSKLDEGRISWCFESSLKMKSVIFIFKSHQMRKKNQKRKGQRKTSAVSYRERSQDWAPVQRHSSNTMH